jgi:hypothetical protein
MGDIAIRQRWYGSFGRGRGFENAQVFAWQNLARLGACHPTLATRNKDVARMGHPELVAWENSRPRSQSWHQRTAGRVGGASVGG